MQGAADQLVEPGSVDAVTTAQVDGRPVVISGRAGTTVRTWDLTARAAA